MKLMDLKGIMRTRLIKFPFQNPFIPSETQICLTTFIHGSEDPWIMHSSFIRSNGATHVLPTFVKFEIVNIVAFREIPFGMFFKLVISYSKVRAKQPIPPNIYIQQCPSHLNPSFLIKLMSHSA